MSIELQVSWGNFNNVEYNRKLFLQAQSDPINHAQNNNTNNKLVAGGSPLIVYGLMAHGSN